MPQDLSPPPALLTLLIERLSSVPPDADATVIQLLAPLPAGKAPWLRLSHLPTPNSPADPAEDQVGADVAVAGGGRVDWALDTEFQRALEAEEVEREHMCALAWAQVELAGADLPAGGGAEGLDPALRSVVERQRVFVPRQLEQGAAAPQAADDNGPPSRMKAGVSGGAAWSEWSQQFVPAHRRAAYAAAAAANRVKAMAMAAEGGEGVWVTADELQKCQGRVPLSVAAVPSESMVDTGRCAGWC